MHWGQLIILASVRSDPTGADRTILVKPYAATRYFGYGYQTWIFPGDRRMFALLGLHGQAIYVDPSSRLVMVETAVNKDTSASRAESVALWQAIVKQLGG